MLSALKLVSFDLISLPSFILNPLLMRFNRLFTRVVNFLLTILGYRKVILFLQQLIDNLDRDLQYAITVEGKMEIDSISNYEDVKNAILQKVSPCFSPGDCITLLLHCP
jgi:hypothetical protein